MKRVFCLLLCLLALSGLALSAFAEGGVADASQMAAAEDVTEPGMTPVYAADLVDGEYPVAFKCSSSMFRIDSALLKVADGHMEVTLTMGSKSFLYVWPGSAEEAASKDNWVEPVEDENGAMTFTAAPLPGIAQDGICILRTVRQHIYSRRNAMKEKRGDIFSGIVIGVLAVVYYVYSFQIQQTTSDVLGSRFFPQLAAILLLFLSAILIIQALRKKHCPE